MLICNFKYLLTFEWQNPIWKLLFLITPPLFSFSSLSYPSAIHLTFGYNLSVFASLFLFVYRKSSQPVLTLCSQPSPQLFPFFSNLPLLQRLPLSQSLLSYLSLFHSWLNTFSSPSLLFPLSSNRSSFISIFHSFTVGYIFSYTSLFFPLPSPLISPSLSPSFSCSQWKLLLSPGKLLWRQTNSEDTGPGGERWHHRPVKATAQVKWDAV